VSADGFGVKDLNRLAQTLAQGAEDFERLSGNAPQIPDAGPSTASVAGAVSSLATVMSKITQSAAVAADQAQESDRTYQNDEDATSNNLGRIRGPH
jgi:hypothetical protein